MRTILFLVRKEFLQVLRDPVLLRMLIAVPFVQLLIVTSAATFEVRTVDVYLLDHDRTNASRRLVDAFTASDRFRVQYASLSGDDANVRLLAGDVSMLLRIPADFQHDLVADGRARVQLVFDGVNGVTASVAHSYAQEILRRYSADRVAELHPEVRVARAGTSSGLDVRTRAWFNPFREYDDFMATGILVFLVTIVGTVMTALNVAREKEQGTIEQLNVTPITRGQFVAGKLIPFWLFGLAELALGLAIAVAVFGVPVRGSLVLVFGAAGLYLVSALAIGLLISTAADTQQQAQFVAFFVLVIYLFLSGLFTPVQSMPEWAEVLADLNPVKHFVTLMRAVLIKGAGAAQVATELLALVAFAAVTLPLAVLRYSKTTA